MDATANEGVAWPELHRVRRAIVVVDVVESVRLMQEHEADVIDRWRRFVNEVRTQVLPKHGGRLVKSLGDGMLLEFPDAARAIEASRAVHHTIAPFNEGKARDAEIWLRIGVNVADIVVDDLDVYGQGVNLAARLAATAQPAETMVSADVRDELASGVDVDLVDLGERFFKNMEDPVRVYALQSPDARGSTPHLPLPSLRPSLAVLTLAAEAEHKALASLVADELAIQASAQGEVDVISRMSTRASSVQTQDPMRLLQCLRADYGISGTAAVVGDRSQLTFELVHVATNRVVWSGSARVTVAALIAAPADTVIDACTQALAALKVHEAGRARSMPIASLRSYTLLMGGVALMHRLGRRDFDQARELLDAVVDRVPRHPDAYAWLAKWHILQAHQGWSEDPAKSQARARDVANRALDRDDRCGLALTVAGMVKVYFERRLDEGEALYRQAIEVNPSDSLAWLLKGTLHAFRDEGTQAVEDTRRALRLSPLDPMRYYYDALAAGAAAAAGLYDEAIDLGERSLRANCMHASTLRVLAICYGMTDQVDLARPVVSRLLTLEPHFNVSRFLERAPAGGLEIGQRFAVALRRAGVPG